MHKSTIDISGALHRQLLKVGDMVNLFDHNDYTAVDTWTAWLVESEQLLKQYGYSETAQLAGLRATILKEDKTAEPVRNRRKRLISQALSTIDPAQNVLYSINKPLEEKISTVRTLIRQFLVPAREAGLIKLDGVTDFTQYIEYLFQQAKTNQQIAPSLNHSLILLGKLDVMRIVAEEIEFL
jgi:hypothetical protein